MLKHLIITAAILLSALSATATDYQTLSLKAGRFFGYGEWASAEAMYSLMLDARPDVPDTYAHAIVAAGMLSDTPRQMQLTDMALTAQVPIDSIFTNVERTSFSVGQTSLYCDYLLRCRQAMPWLQRSINGYLLKYYTSRRDAKGMIQYSRIMLDGLPDNEAFLYTLAQGYLIDGDETQAIATYMRILDINPQAYRALLYLGNYYAPRASADPTARNLAIDYLRRAMDITPTPHVQEILHRLTHENQR